MCQATRADLAAWIAFHEVLGVEGFLIYDNASADETREILAGIRSAVVIDWPGERRQFDAYADAVARSMLAGWRLSTLTSTYFRRVIYRCRLFWTPTNSTMPWRSAS